MNAAEQFAIFSDIYAAALIVLIIPLIPLSRLLYCYSDDLVS